MGCPYVQGVQVCYDSYLENLHKKMNQKKIDVIFKQATFP